MRRAAVPACRAASPVIRPADDRRRPPRGLLNGASRVTILAGRRLRRGARRADRLAGRCKAPIVHALRGKEFVEYDNPYDVGMTGLLGFSSGYRAMEHCDALLMLGTDFPYRQFYPEDATIIQVDVRGEQHRPPGDRSTCRWSATVKDTIDALLPLLAPKTRAEHLNRMHGALPAGPRAARRAGHGPAERPPIHPQYVAAAIDRLAARRRGVHRGRRHADYLGRALPADERPAPAASARSTTGPWPTRCRRRSARRPASPAGRWSRCPATAVSRCCSASCSRCGSNSLPVKVVVFNNGALSFVELEMKAAGIVNFGTDLDNPTSPGWPGPPVYSGSGWTRRASSTTRCRTRSATTGPPWSTSGPRGMSCRCRRSSPTASSRASRCTRPGPSCPARRGARRARQDEPS